MVDLTEQNFAFEILQSNLPVLVDFYADWCGPCQMASPVLEELAKEYEGKVRFGKVNVDQGQTLAQKYGVMSIPTLIIFQNGKEVARQVGFSGKKALIDLILKVKV